MGDDADGLGVSFGVLAENAEGVLGDIHADRTEADFFLDLDQGLAEFTDLLTRGSEDVKCEPAGGFLSNAGQFSQVLDQPLDGI